MERLRIGINALYLIPGGVGGTEIYLRNLLRAFAAVDRDNEYVVFTNHDTGLDLVPAYANFTAVPMRVKAADRPERLLWEQVQLPREARRLRLDCLFNPGFTAPMFASCPNVTVFHDLQHIRHPEFFDRASLLGWRLFLWQSARSTRVFVAVSEATARDLAEAYGIPREWIHVVPHGVEREILAIGELPRTPERMVLCVSTLHPHKNIDVLVRAFARLRSRFPEHRLVLAGMRGFYTEQVEQAVSACGVTSAVSITGWIPRAELHELYRRAEILAYPSGFEGFGMPVLEGMAAGVPVVCSDLQPLREIASDAALLVEPGDEDALYMALCRVASDAALRDRLTIAGRRRAAGQTWEAAAKRTLAAIRHAYSGSTSQNSAIDRGISS